MSTKPKKPTKKKETKKKESKDELISTGTIAVTIKSGIANKTKADTLQRLMKVQHDIGLMLQQLDDPSYTAVWPEILSALHRLYSGIRDLPASAVDTKSSWTWTGGANEKEEK